ncbi:hypothetical protein C3509_25855 [Salmonella enterica]|nr:hypothetical protein [Salmonella enterica]
MTTITRERLLKIQQWRETYGTGSNVMLPAEEAEELARIALAALEAEPIGYMNRFTGRVFSLDEQPGADTDTAVYEPVYATPPALVATGATYSGFEDFWSACKHPFAQDDELKDVSWVIWNACRSAMLNGGKS